VLVACTATLAGGILTVLGIRYGAVAIVGLPVALLLLGWALERPLVAVAGIPLCLPVAFTYLPGGLQVIHATTLLAVGVVVLHRLSAGRGPLPAPAGTGLLLGLVGLVAVAVVGAPNRGFAVNQTVTVIVAALGLLAVVGACQNFTDVRRMVGLILVGGLIVCGLALPQASSVSGSAGAVNVSGVTGIFSEHNQFGAFAAAIALLAAGMLFGARTRWRRWAAGVTGLVALGCVALALSRGAYLGMALGVLVFVYLVPPARRRLLAVAVALVAGLGIVLIAAPDNRQVRLIVDRFATFSNPAANPEDDRPAIWAEAFRQIRLHPWAGSGPANFPVVAAHTESPVTFFVPAHAHDVLLTVAAEIGLPAAAALIVLTLLWTRTFLRTAKAQPDVRDRGVMAGLAGAAATFIGEGVFDATLRASVILVLLALCAGLALAAAEHIGVDRSAVPSPPRGMRGGRLVHDRG
jgi:O-antigen ligase